MLENNAVVAVVRTVVVVAADQEEEVLVLGVEVPVLGVEALDVAFVVAFAEP